MCLAVPALILEVFDEGLARTARVSFAGIVRNVSLACLPMASSGDFVIVHAGLALAIIDEVAAVETLRWVEGRL